MRLLSWLLVLFTNVKNIDAQGSVFSTTNFPTINPTHTPSLIPSGSISSFPTFMPTPELTSIPSTVSVSSAPTLILSNEPSTASPTQLNTSKPSLNLSNAPSSVASDEPSILFSDEPTTVASSSPSLTTSSIPTTSPTNLPTKLPSLLPSQLVSLSPSNTPTFALSEIPSAPKSTSPTTFPTPNFVPVKQTLSGLKIEFEPAISILGIKADWESATQEHIKSYHLDNNPILKDVFFSILFQEEKMKTNPDAVIITFQTYVEYLKPELNPLTGSDFVSEPFQNLARRQNYTEILKKKNSGFDSLDKVTPVRFPEESNPNVRLIIIIAVASAVLVILIFILLYCFRKQRQLLGNFTQDDRPLALPQSSYDDENINNLRIPPKIGGTAASESLSGFEDPSVGTVDYDYNKAFPGDSSVSSAGGTLGELTRGTVGTPGPSPSLFSTEESFDNIYSGVTTNVKETLIEVLAPPGKLGVVIDTPDDGAPVVHAIKDTSVIRDKLKVGDQLVAVDGEDVRQMTAIKVSKLISRKGTQASRKLTLIRRE